MRNDRHRDDSPRNPPKLTRFVSRALLSRTPALFTMLLILASFAGLNAGEKEYVKLNAAQMQQMLETVKADLKDHYYDPKMHGLDLDKRFDEAKQKIALAKSQDEALLDIYAAVAALKDSHTSFRPPIRPYGVDYGWSMQAVGESDCYVTGVRPESDAAVKGLKAGDRILSVNGIPITRADEHVVRRSYDVFPQSGLHLTFQTPDGVPQNIVAMSKVIPGQIMISHADFMAWARSRRGIGFHDRSRYHEVNKKALFWKLPDFVIDPDDVDPLLNRMHSFDVVVLDLRGNPGGIVTTAAKFIGELFNHEVKIAEYQGRDETKATVTRTRGGKTFAGKLIVLIDGSSMSASEVLARVVQLEKRGTILGDRSAGIVMESKTFVHAVALDRINVTQYYANVSVANLIMTDGNSLENVGVSPDERILPTPADIAAGRDPVLARAAALAGIEMTSEEAGRIFPFEWAKERMPEID